MILDLNPETFTAAKVTKITGVKRTRLQDWIERGWIRPSIHKGVGAGNQNIYSEEDLFKIATFRHLVESGLPRKNVAGCIKALNPILSNMQMQDVFNIQFWAFGWTGDHWQARPITEDDLSWETLDTLLTPGFLHYFVVNFAIIRDAVCEVWKPSKKLT